jgi:hypothetical protein
MATDKGLEDVPEGEWNSCAWSKESGFAVALRDGERQQHLVVRICIS